MISEKLQEFQPENGLESSFVKFNCVWRRNSEGSSEMKSDRYGGALGICGMVGCLLFGAVPAIAGLNGKTVGLTWLQPNTSTVYAPPGESGYVYPDAVVGTGIEFPGVDEGCFNLDLADAQIKFYNLAASAPPGCSGAFTAATFNGFEITDVNGNVNFTSVAVDAASNLAATVTFDAHHIFVNVEGLGFAANSSLVLDVTTLGSPSFAYVANEGSNEVSLYTAGAGTGVLTPQTSFPTPSPLSIVATPSGKLAYVTNYLAAGTISAFNINSSTGALTAVAGSPYSAGSYPYRATLAPSSQFLYAANDGSNNVSGFSINPATGALTPVPGSPFPVGQNPYAVGFSPSGRFAYVANAGADSISAFTVNLQTGALTPVPGSPFADPGVPKSITANGPAPQFVAVEPSGHFAYVSNTGSWTIAIYSIDQTTGALTPIAGSPFPTAPEPDEITFASSGLAYVTTSGTALSRQDGSVSVYSVNSATGALTPVAGSPFVSGADTSWVALGPAGFAYATNAYSDTVSAFSIDPASGALSPIAGSPFATGSGPQAIALASGSTQGCVDSLSSLEQGFGVQGGLSSFGVDASATCSWNAISSADWITILPSASKGAGKVNFAVSPNGGGARTGNISVGGQNFAIDQAGFGCSYSIGPTFASPGDTGGPISVSVSAPGGCPWTAVSKAAWITVSSHAAGSGAGVVLLNVAPNVGTPRTGTVTIAGKTFSVTEGAGGCGALDVTSQMAIVSTGLVQEPFSANFTQSILITNNSGGVLHGPVYLVLLGEPTHYGAPYDSVLLYGDPLTACYSSPGDYLVAVSSGDMAAGVNVTIPLTWNIDTNGRVEYTTKVLSGTPSH